METLKGIAKEVILFLTSGLFLKNLAGMVAVVVGFVFLSNQFLSCYTRHGESVQLDNFVGMSLADAKRMASRKGFRFEVIDSSVFKIGQPSGIILTQDPAPMQRVKQGRKIYVSVTGGPRAYRLPALKGGDYDYDSYARRLAHANIRTRIKEQVFDKRQENNSILYFFHQGKKITEADLDVGYYVMPGDELEFVVTVRLSNELTVPELVCMEYAAAEFLASSHNLIIGKVNEIGAVSNQAAAFVTHQDPPAGDPIQMGQQITVWLSQQRPSNCSDGDDAESAPANGHQEDQNW